MTKSTDRTGLPGIVAAFAAASMLAGIAGCSTLFAVRGQQELAGETAVVSGMITTDHVAAGPLIVGLIARGKDGYYLLDHFIAEKPGPWIFAVDAGTYRIAAFEDVNHDGSYNDEPALRAEASPPIELAAGQQLGRIALSIPKAGRFARDQFSLEELRARSPEDQQRVSLFARSVAGKVTTIDDPRFARARAEEGMWKYYDFILDAQPGIYFLQAYDPDKTPVLFVHGIGGTPRDFSEMIAALDHTKFQPWVYYYPSGAKLEVSAALLAQLFVRVREQYDVEKAAVVAHSMGGLVSREFLIRDFERNGTQVVRTYVTISSPLGGMASAGAGVEQSPIVVDSWRGLAPGSLYLEGLFYRDPATKKERRRLPAHMAWHMMFGFHSRASDDGVVAISSQLRPEAQQEARSLRGFDEDHTSILRSKAAAARLNEILADRS